MKIAKKICDFLRYRICKESESIEKSSEEPDVKELLDRILFLENELNRQKAIVSQMRREYESLLSERNNENGKVREEAQEMYLSQIVNRLAMLVTLACGYRNKLGVELEDVVNQIFWLEKDLISAGLEPIGRPGEVVKYDASLHQPMSIGIIADGASVVIKIQGYRLREKILAKAVVAKVEG
ncbi:MAG: hypothetical protein N2487_02400 [Verrucomicrobiae bacterium]|nr:hypothetical protein [Verrucomicrobiae bacterium]